MSEDELKSIAEKHCNYPVKREKEIKMTGAFTSKDVVKLLDIPFRQLDYWIRIGLAKSSILSSKGKGSARIYSFFDLIQIRNIKALFDSGMPIKKIKKSMKYLEKKLSFSFPTTAIFVTDGDTNFRIVKTNGELIRAIDTILHKKQGVFFIHIGKFKKEMKEKVAK